MPQPRRSLTPLESELRATTGEQHGPAAPGRLTRLRRRFRREPPTTLLGAIAAGLSRLAIAVALASGIALLVDHWLHRSASLGFYIVGAGLMAVAFGSTTGVGRAWRVVELYDGHDSRARRVNLGFAYVLAGAFVIGIAVAIEAFGGS